MYWELEAKVEETGGESWLCRDIEHKMVNVVMPRSSKLAICHSEVSYVIIIDIFASSDLLGPLTEISWL